MNMAKAKVFGTAILTLAIILVSCDPQVSNIQMRRGVKADGTVGSGGPPVTNQTLIAPTGVNTTVLSTGRIRVSWNAVPGATSYRVYYGDPNDSTMRYYVIVTAPSTSWEDNDALDNGHTYYYQVQAINTGGEGPLSNVTHQAYTPTTTSPPSGNGSTYTVTFNANGGSGTVPSQTVNAGSSITLPSGSGLSKSGYTFEGWNTNSSGTGTTYSAGASYTPASDITLYAKWNIESVSVTSYTVTFSANGGSGTVPSQTVNAGSSITLPSGSGLSRSGYTFEGWNTSTGITLSVGSSYWPIRDETLYARWEAIVVSSPYPPAPTGVTAVLMPDNNTIVVSWTPAPGTEGLINGNRISVVCCGVGVVPGPGGNNYSNAFSTSNTSYTFTSNTSGKTYNFQVGTCYPTSGGGYGWRDGNFSPMVSVTVP